MIEADGEWRQHVEALEIDGVMLVGAFGTAKDSTIDPVIGHAKIHPVSEESEAFVNVGHTPDNMVDRLGGSAYAPAAVLVETLHIVRRYRK